MRSSLNGIVVFIAILIAVSASAADLKGAVAINPATGQKVGRVISIKPEGVELDSPAAFGKGLYLVSKEQWEKGRCGECHGA